jgi:N-carbamoylputrescine amidase
MAAIVSGCYVFSSNRLSGSSSRPRFGGRGFAYSPTGELLGVTSKEAPAISIEVDRALVIDAQRRYPCYVEELVTAGMQRRPIDSEASGLGVTGLQHSNG